MKNLDLNTLCTIKDIEEYRKNINEACDKRIELIGKYSKAINLGNKMFGAIKENIENISPLLFETKEGKSILSRYKKCISSSKDLSNLYSIYETIRKAGKNADSAFIINEISSNGLKSSKSKLDKEIEPLRKIMEEAYLIVGERANELLSEGNVKTNSAIEYIYTNKKNSGNIAEYAEAYKIIKEYIESKESHTSIFENKKFQNNISEMIRSFNEKYSGSLNKEDENIVRSLSTGENQEKIFEDYKEICLSKINSVLSEAISVSDKERLEKIQEQISNKQYSKEAFANDLHKLIEINNIL